MPKPKITRKPHISIPGIEPRIHQNGVTRPRKFFRDGRPNKCVRIWEIADEISVKHAQDAHALARKTKKKHLPGPATRKEVLAQCVKEKIKYTTFVNEFYSWRIFNGIHGRIKKDGTKAKPMGFQGDKPRKGAKRPDIRPVSAKPPLPNKPPLPVATKPATASPWGK